MNEITVNWNELQGVLAPKFEGRTVRITWNGDTAELSVGEPQKNRHFAKGILKKYIKPYINPYESGAWEKAVIEKYENRLYN